MTVSYQPIRELYRVSGPIGSEQRLTLRDHWSWLPGSIHNIAISLRDMSEDPTKYPSWMFLFFSQYLYLILAFLARYVEFLMRFSLWIDLLESEFLIKVVWKLVPHYLWQKAGKHSTQGPLQRNIFTLSPLPGGKFLFMTNFSPELVSSSRFSWT